MNIAIKAAVESRTLFKKSLKDSLYVAYGQKKIVRNNDVEYSFRQSSDFLYLTAFAEPDAVLILTEKEELLFVPKLSQTHKVWVGGAPEPIEIEKVYKIKVCFLDDLAKHLKRLNKKHTKCYTENKNRKFIKKTEIDFEFSNEVLGQLKENRSIKNEFEIQSMQKASDASSLAHCYVMKHAKAGMFEYEIQNLFESFIQKKGFDSLAYPTIAGTGVNGATLHYEKKSSKTKSGDFFLIDAGAENRGYAADITRTFPINGKFTKKQQEIYEIVLNAQLESIKALRAGVWLSEIHDLSVEIISKGLLDLSILKGSLSECIDKKAYKLFYPHGLSHTLGLDVHDVVPVLKTKKKASIRSEMFLQNNQVVTIEPGIYFIPVLLNDTKVQEEYAKVVNWKKVSQYKNFGGIRIEDNLIISNNKAINLTQVPKTCSDIEKLMK